MMLDAHARLNAELPWKNIIQQEDSFHQETGLKFKEVRSGWSATFGA
jgi:hypothetical protein